MAENQWTRKPTGTATHLFLANTQIARVSYPSAVPSRLPTATAIETPFTTQVQRMEYKGLAQTAQAFAHAQNIKATQHAASRAKGERDKETHEMQPIFVEITKRPAVTEAPPAEIGSPNAKMVEDNAAVHDASALRRAKTDLQVERPSSGPRRLRGAVGDPKTRSKLTQQTMTKSHELLPQASPQKKRSYNQEETRRFMEEQRKKRTQAALEQLNKTRNKEALEKEQIKQRLQQLNKFTRQILHKNIRMKHAAPQHRTDDRPTPNKTIQRAPANDEAARTKVKISPRNTNTKVRSVENVEAPPLELHNIEVESVTALEPQEPQQEPQQEPAESRVPAAVSNTLIENRRVGLLRKPEIKDHSFSAITEFSFDKENVALEMMTPQLSSIREPRIKESQPPPPPQNDEKPQSTSEQAGNSQPHEIFSRHRSQPAATREKSTQVKDTPSLQGTAKERDGPPDLPYWLKPSAVQVYPYNFIVAVRRKLEAITNLQTHQPRAASIRKTTTATSTTDLHPQKVSEATPLETVTKERAAEAEQNLNSRIIPDCGESPEESEVNLTQTIESNGAIKHLSPAPPSPALVPVPPPHSSSENVTKSQALSELHSSFSSISIQMAASNSISGIAPYKSETSKTLSRSKSVAQFEEDDTTVSSSIFNSPSRRVSSRVQEEFVFAAPRPVSPLSLEHIDHLTIASKTKQESLPSRRVTTKHADALPPTRKAVRSTDSDADDIDFVQLLSDFNRSLSQVIQVNEQLKGTLDMTDRVATSPERKSASENIVSHVYTTDFEESSLRATKHKDSDASSKKRSAMALESTEQRRQTLIKIADSVEQLKSPTSAKKEQETEAEALPTMNLNLESITNSSIQSSLDDACSTAEDADVPALGFESRMQLIEDLKSNLRQKLHESKARRMREEKVENAEDKSPKQSKEQSEKSGLSRSGTQYSQTHTHSDTSYSDQRTSENSGKKTTVAGSTHSSAKPKCRRRRRLSRTKSTSPWQDDSNFTDSAARGQHSLEYAAAVQSSPSAAQNSSNGISASISEEIQHEHESPNQANMNGNEKAHATQSPTETPPNATKSLSTPPARSRQQHVNSFRGDFLPKADDNAVANESHFLAAVTALRKQSEAQQEDEDAGPMACSAASSTPSATEAIAISLPAAPKQLHHNKSPGGSGKAVTTPQSEKKAMIASDLEVSIASMHNGTPLSESSLSYSSVGVYEKLIQKETTKSEQLTSLLKMREKALIDRTRGQMAWLEVQKERYKAKGLMEQISAVKKKQRAILLKMEREREEIKRLLQVTTTTNSATTTSTERGVQAAAQRRDNQPTAGADVALPESSALQPQPPALLSPAPAFRFPKASRSEAHHLRRHQRHQRHASGAALAPATTRSAPIVRADYALETSRPLEELLQRREADLRRRRDHVERLMHWHQRLDQEEAEVLQLEHMLMSYNNVRAADTAATPASVEPAAVFGVAAASTADTPTPTTQEKNAPSAQRSVKAERRLKEIDQSLRELNSISSSNSAVSNAVQAAEDSSSAAEVGGAGTGGGGDFVRTTGSKLNKLWRRLTSQQVEKFEPGRRYKLCKTDLEHLYEEAKREVLREFAQDEARIATELLDRSSLSFCSHSSSSGHRRRATTADADSVVNKTIVPPLELNSTSSDHSDSGEQAEQVEGFMHAEEEESVADASTHSLPQGNYSPSAAQEDFNQRPSSNRSSTSGSDVDWCSTRSHEEPDRAQQNERNLQQFLLLMQRRAASPAGGLLQRSHSDTQLADAEDVRSFSRSTLALGTATAATTTGCTRTESPTNQTGSQDTNCADYEKSIKASSKRQTSARTEISNIPSSHGQQSAVKAEIATATTSTDSNGNASATSHSAQSTNQSRTSSAGGNFSESTTSASSDLASPATAQDIEASSGALVSPSAASVRTAPSNECSEASLSPSTASVASVLASWSTCTMTALTAEPIMASSNEISRSVDEISVALSHLSLPSVLPTYQSRKSFETQSLNNGGEEANVSSNDDPSYTLQFENISTDMHSSLSVSHNHGSGSRALDHQVSSPNRSAPSPEVGKLRPLTLAEEENAKDTTYETDFESGGDETLIDELSLPHFETTIGTSATEEVDNETRNLCKSAEVDSSAVVEARAKDSLPPPPPLPPPQAASPSQAATAGAGAGNGAQLMPDIINELEIRRCQQMLLESEQLKQYEHVTAVPYMYMREIPNKPPPPYVPPAHGSPMTTIFPSEDRIKDITYRRSHELYCQLIETEYIDEKGEKLPSVTEEKITNIYERIILDICREYLDDHRDVLSQGDPAKFYSPLAFFNPPDRLRCIQESIYKEVRRCLAMDKPSPKRTQVYSVYGQRARRDHIGKIIIDEMNEEDDRWCNFHIEENEVLELIVEEMIVNGIQQLAREVLLEEGGTIDEDDNADVCNKDEDLAAGSICEDVAETSSAVVASTTLETRPSPLPHVDGDINST